VKNDLGIRKNTGKFTQRGDGHHGIAYPVRPADHYLVYPIVDRHSDN
jgi:hypothetical protein